MQTRLSLFCEGLIEAITLAAVVLVPLFFNTTTSTVGELDKAVLVRILAWLAALAWLVQRLETRPSLLSLRSLRARDLARLPPLTLPAALFLLAAALATLFSIAPRVSFWGSPVRVQGFYTILAYVVLFLAARRALQSHDQVARLVTAVVVASLPVTLYVLAQALKLDPIRWPAREVGRPSSSIGNPIFVGEYLVMILPLTIAALVTAWRAARRQADLSRYLATGALVVLVGLQLAALVVTQSRGAFWGLLASGVYLGLLLAARAGDRRLLGGLAVAALAVVGLLLLINLPGSPLAAVRRIPYLGRLTQALNPKSATGQTRVLQWEAGVALATSDPARLMVGYGHDATRYAIGPFIPSDLYRLLGSRRTDRVHNELLDILASGGLVSLAAYLLLFLSAMRLGLTRLGLLGQRPGETWLLAAVSLGGGLLGGAVAWALAGPAALLAPAWVSAGTPAFVPPAFGMGLVGGLGLYLLAHPFLVPTSGPRTPRMEGEGQPLLVAGLLAALVGHLVAFQFSFGVVVTRTLFWVDLALLTALTARLFRYAFGYSTQAGGAPRPNPASGRRRRRRRHPAAEAEAVGQTVLLKSVGEDRLARSLLLGLILGVLLADFLLTGVDLSNPTLLGLVGLTWVLGGVLILAGAGDGLTLDRSGATWPALSLGWGLLFPLLMGLIRLRPVLDPTLFYLLFLAWLGLTLAGLAVALSRAEAKHLLFWRSRRWPWYLGLVLVVGLAIFLTNVNLISADINVKMAEILGDAGRLDSSIVFYRRALALVPDHDGYYSDLAQAYLSRAQAAADADQRTADLEEAWQAMKRATELAPMDAVHFWNLGLLYQFRAEEMADPGQSREWLEQALDSLLRATALEPYQATLYVEQAQVYLALERYEEAAEASQQALERYGGAVEAGQRALEREEGFEAEREVSAWDDHSAGAHALLGDAYRGLGQLPLAEESYQQALALKPKSAEAHRGLAALRLAQGEPEAARDEALAALAVAPTDYASLKTLALAHQALGSIQEALDAAQQARAFAPPSQRPALETLIAELEEAQKR